MRAYHRVSGAVRLEMKPHSTYSYEISGDGGRRLIVSAEEFEELATQIRDGDVEKAELKRELEETKERLRRVSEDRVTWKEAAHSHAADLARMTDEAARLSDERDQWKERVEGGLSRAGVSSLAGIRRAARVEHAKYPDEAGEFHKSIDALERAAIAAVYEENDSGGHARVVVADAARVLGVDIDEGPGHRWDPEHMERVVAGARELCDEVSELQRQVRQLVSDLGLMTAQRDEAAKHAASVEALRPIRMEVPAELFTASADEELKATIVRQAREITRLKGESE